MNNDRLGYELLSIMEEETKPIEISSELMNKIIFYKKKTRKDKINNFLNKEIKIPLIPVVASLVLIVSIVYIPKDLMAKEKIKVVNIGSSQIIFREGKGVNKDYED